MLRFLTRPLLIALAALAAGAAGSVSAQPGPATGSARTFVTIPGSTLIPPYGSVTFSTGASDAELTTSSSIEVDSDTPEPVTAGYSATGPAGDGSLPGLLTLTAPDGAVAQVQSGCRPQGAAAQTVSCAVSAVRAQGSGSSISLTSRVWFMTLAAGASLPPGSCPLPIPPASNTPPPGPFIPGQPGVSVCDARFLGISAIGGPVGSDCFPPPAPLTPGTVMTFPPPTPSPVTVPGGVCLRDDSASVTFYDPRSNAASPAQVTVTADGGGAGTTIVFDDLGLAITSAGGPVIVTTEPDPCEPSGDRFTTVICPGVTLDPPSSVEFTVDTAHPQMEHILTVPAGWSLMGFPDGTILPRDWAAYTLDPAAPDAGYIQMPLRSVVKGGAGYWVDVSSDSTQRDLVPAGAATPQTAALPPGRWTLIGNPFNGDATISGADALLIYDPVTRNYRPATALYPGQGALAYSAAGGTLTLSP